MIEITRENAVNFGVAWKRCRKIAVVECVRMVEPFSVATIEGRMRGKAGDYLMKGINGEVYPCDAGIFEKTYEIVE